MDGKRYLKMFDAGMKYSEIARECGVCKNTVAGDIHQYRKDNFLSVKNPDMARNKKKAFSNKLISKDEKKLRKKRIAVIKSCPVRADGVIQCPPSGYGNIYD